MDEKKILDQIKKSGENIDAPEALQPEQIKRMLKTQPITKKKRFLRYAQWGAVAAVFVLVIVGGVTGLSRMSKMNVEKEAESEVILAEAQTEQQGKMLITEQGEGAQVGTEETKTEETRAFIRAGSYQEVFQALKKIEEDIETEYATAELARGVEDGTTESGASAPTAASKDVSYSKTNLQEAGVDEGDIIKTDGKYLYVMKTTGSVSLIRAEGKELHLEGTILLEKLNETPQEIYLDQDKLLLVTTGSITTLKEISEDSAYETETEDYTKLYTYDISDKSEPKLEGTVQQQGYYRTSRKNGNIFYLLTQFDPEVNEEDKIEEYIPAVNGARLESSDIYLPEYKNSTSYLVISSVNIQQPEKLIDQKAIISASDHFYVSEENIYIVNSTWRNESTISQILKFSCQEGKISSKGVADIKGSLNDSFSLNEYNGYLRVVITDYSSDTMTNMLYVLDEDMKLAGSIYDLAEGEDIRSARFMGDIGYFVTFKDTDPLFSVDLSNPYDPQILGELKITGFSSYLHFYGEDRLLGVGNEVDPETGMYTGIKLSMFDISDPSNVKEVHKFVLKDNYDSPLFYNYKTAMIDPEKNVFGFLCDNNYMIFCYDEEDGFQNVFTENLGDSYYENYYNTSWGMRGCYIEDSFYLIGAGQIRIYDMAEKYKEMGRLEL